MAVGDRVRITEINPKYSAGAQAEVEMLSIISGIPETEIVKQANVLYKGKVGTIAAVLEDDEYGVDLDDGNKGRVHVKEMELA
jgi:hypothetical protein